MPAIQSELIQFYYFRAVQTNVPNVGAVEQQTEMAESMVSRNAALAEQAIKSLLLLAGI